MEVRCQGDFRIRGRLETLPKRFEFDAKLGVVVNLAVKEDDAVADAYG